MEPSWTAALVLAASAACSGSPPPGGDTDTSAEVQSSSGEGGPSPASVAGSATEGETDDGRSTESSSGLEGSSGLEDSSGSHGSGESSTGGEGSECASYPAPQRSGQTFYVSADGTDEHTCEAAMNRETPRLAEYVTVEPELVDNITDEDPRFVSFEPDGSGDYRLRADSPAIDSGAPDLVSLLPVDTDYDGGPRPLGAGPDIGPFELGHGCGGDRVSS